MDSRVVSDIGPSWTKLQPEVQLWASRMADLARSKMDGSISAILRPYRHLSGEYLSVEMVGQKSGSMSVTIAVGAVRTNFGFDDLERTCFDFSDMTEALTMVGLLLRDTDAHVSLGSF
ncbi:MULTISPECIES: hypothetical protein [Pseudomonas syringae group genomosp. 2]|uniref:Uncharacterized protein n=2 Tax=Pseudomonas amygdali TaxID=47877 RepID=A0AAX1VQ86_PSEAJ|nr:MULTISPECIES: hypothetical protein [Pseudomonas syringae group genomosp. 2]KPX74373.1 hypothetical protein ALO35_103169 [Pseudomonas amygdali pv. lachrymans]KEZ71265.1 hypothetical protein C1E_0200135 [Pseudomonas amygdali pv. tabaci str. ATCC 11528]QED82951.1 hypothetical protein PSYTB_04125 [Pseudomonas amygdali pv. tabaci str. ATCC 11528]QOI03212.1 hypothetical protein D5S10_04515 [Pseudomonas savastanoi]RML77701.1 hypothetical protein ALQ89_01751 [Pseudomonas amygdali pv. tabaci]